MGPMFICHIVCTCEGDQHVCKREIRLCTKRPVFKKRPIWDLFLHVTLSVRVKETNMCVKEKIVCVHRDLLCLKKRPIWDLLLYVTLSVRVEETNMCVKERFVFMIQGGVES